MELRFNENDDLVIENIPDDLLELSDKLAEQRGMSREDIWRDLIVRLAPSQGN